MNGLVGIPETTVITVNFAGDLSGLHGSANFEHAPKAGAPLCK